MTRRLMLLDTAALYFRAFYGVPDTVRAPDGRPVNAVRGLLDMIARLVDEFSPTDLIACWDEDWRPQWRVDLLPGYKAHRVVEAVAQGPDVEEVPDPLETQVPVIREVLDALGIRIVGAADHEADDVIGTLAAHADMPVDVVTGDRDLFQVVDDERQVRVIYTGRGMARLEVLDDAAVVGKYGVHASQYADMAVLRGDPSDGLPGVAGIGEKTAAALLSRHGTLAGVLSAADDPATVMSASVRAKLAVGADYLAVAPRVVAVATGLDLPAVDARLREPDEASRARLDELAAAHGVRTSLDRAAAAIAAVA